MIELLPLLVPAVLVLLVVGLVLKLVGAAVGLVLLPLKLLWVGLAGFCVIGIALFLPALVMLPTLLIAVVPLVLLVLPLVLIGLLVKAIFC